MRDETGWEVQGVSMDLGVSLGVVLAFLRNILPHEGADMTAHNISRNRERAIGLFLRSRGVAKTGTIGGCFNSGHEVLRLVLLVRWGRDGVAAEAKARQVYRAVAGGEYNHEGARGFMMAVNEGPVWNGFDDRGVNEYTLDFDLYVEKEEKHGISG